MKESAVTFGDDGRLFGMLTTPEPASPRPCLLILNAGLVYRAGPARLSVALARRAARAGFPALRIDLSGFGDSAPRLPPLSPVATAVADVREAMNHLGATQGIRRFVVAGLCSGAVNAHHAAAADERIVGAVMLDTYVFPTLRSRWAQVAEHLSMPRPTLRGSLRRLGRLIVKSRRPVGPPPAEDGFLPEWPAKSTVEKDLRLLRKRGAALLYVYSGEWSRWYRYEGQMRDAFRRLELDELLTERLVPNAEHLYFMPPEREAMLALVVGWLEGEFGAAP